MSVRFGSGIDAAMRAIEDEVGQVTRKVGIQTLSGVVLKTPVRSGRARANWNVSIGRPDDSTTQETDKNGESTIGEGTQEIESAGNAPVIWLTNNLPYIGRLEDGSSQQAPSGMAAVTVAEVTGQFRR